MENLRELADDLFRERVLSFRRNPPSDRLLMGAKLFDDACGIALDGIRAQHSDWTAEQCQRELSRRIELDRRLSDGDLYRPMESLP